MSGALVPPYIEALRPFTTGPSVAEIAGKYGLSRVYNLAWNENPLGPSPRALERMRGAFSSLHRYDSGLELREELASRFGLSVANVTAGNGSEGILANIVRTFLSEGDEALTSEGTFPSFRTLVTGRGARCRTVPMRANFAYDLGAIANTIGERTQMIYLANPNNPTGAIFTRAEFDYFYPRVPRRILILLDEAYFEFAAANAAYPDSMDYRYDNVITLRTFSKAYGLAGIRCGYAFAHESLIAQIQKLKLPFEPSALANAAGLGALGDEDYLAMSVAQNAQGRRLLTDTFRSSGLWVVESEANFVMAAFPSADDAASWTQRLLERGVIVRHLTGFGLPQCVRVTVGTQEQNEFLLKALTTK